MYLQNPNLLHLHISVPVSGLSALEYTAHPIPRTESPHPLLPHHFPQPRAATLVKPFLTGPQIDCLLPTLHPHSDL